MAQFSELFICNGGDLRRIFDNPRIRHQETGHVRPVFIHVCVHGPGDQSAGNIASAPGEGADFPVPFRAVESGNHRGFSVRQLRGREREEITAIRSAEKALGTHDLSGCVIYTTGEPCPMCLAACLWANLKKVYFGCTIADNSRIGFRDEIFDNLTGGRENLKGYLEQVDREKCLALFDEYTKTDRTLY